MAPVLWMSGALLLIHPLYCQDVKSYRYAIPVPAQSGRIAELLPNALNIVSYYPLSLDARSFLAQQYIVAAQAAFAFAGEEGLELQRRRMPGRIVMCPSPAMLAEVTGLPGAQYGGLVVARVDLGCGVVYLGRRDPSDLYVELGKWFFYEEGMRWGENRVEDLRRLGLAERFAASCQKGETRVAVR